MCVYNVCGKFEAASWIYESQRIAKVTIDKSLTKYFFIFMCVCVCVYVCVVIILIKEQIILIIALQRK